MTPEFYEGVKAAEVAASECVSSHSTGVQPIPPLIGTPLFPHPRNAIAMANEIISQLGMENGHEQD